MAMSMFNQYLKRFLTFPSSIPRTFIVGTSSSQCLIFLISLNSTLSSLLSFRSVKIISSSIVILQELMLMQSSSLDMLFSLLLQGFCGHNLSSSFLMNAWSLSVNSKSLGSE